ncbi:MAG: hypothetical protein ACP5OZ_03745 [Candidatus Woesearchaeota archaeon]
MKCSICNKKAEIQYGFSRPLCREHFLRVLSSRVKKNLRKKKIFEGRERFVFLDDSSHDFETLLQIVLPIAKAENRNYEIKRINSRYKFKIPNDYKKSAKIFIPWTANDTATMFIKSIVEGKKPCIKGYIPKAGLIKPLECLLDSESFLFCILSKEHSKDEKNALKGFLKEKNVLRDSQLKEIGDLVITKRDSPDKEIRFFLNRVEEFHPGTIFSVASYIRKLEH